MVQRCQEVQLRTWCSSRSASSLLPANPSRFPAGSGELHQLGQRHRSERAGAVEGVLAVADAVPEQQPVRPAASGRGRVGGLAQGPVIPAGEGALPWRRARRTSAAGPGGQPPGQLDRDARADPGNDKVTPGYGQDVAEPAGGQSGAQGRVLAVDRRRSPPSRASRHLAPG